MSRPVSPAQVRLVAGRCRAAGLDDAGRAHVAAAVSQGRTRSARGLASGEVEQVLVVCELIEAGHVVVDAAKGLQGAADGRVPSFPLDVLEVRRWMRERGPANSPAPPAAPASKPSVPLGPLRFPRTGTDCDRFLADLMEHAARGEVAWNTSVRLGITSHSRASDLRRMGWDVESIRGARVQGSQKNVWGWRLLTPIEAWNTAQLAASEQRIA